MGLPKPHLRSAHDWMRFIGFRAGEIRRDHRSCLEVLEAMAVNEVRQVENWLGYSMLPSLAQQMIWAAVGANTLLWDIDSPRAWSWSEMRQRIETATGCRVDSDWILEGSPNPDNDHGVISLADRRSAR